MCAYWLAGWQAFGSGASVVDMCVIIFIGAFTCRCDGISRAFVSNCILTRSTWRILGVGCEIIFCQITCADRLDAHNFARLRSMEYVTRCARLQVNKKRE